MRGGILRFGGDGGVEMGEGFAMSIPGRGDYAEIVGNGGMAGTKAESVTVGGFRLIETPGLVMGDRVGNNSVEFTVAWFRHAMRL